MGEWIWLTPEEQPGLQLSFSRLGRNFQFHRHTHGGYITNTFHINRQEALAFVIESGLWREVPEVKEIQIGLCAARRLLEAIQFSADEAWCGDDSEYDLAIEQIVGCREETQRVIDLLKGLEK